MSELPVETTVVEAIAGLRADGFDQDFSVSRSGGVRCGACGTKHAAAELTVAATVRVEGMSNPDDEAVVFGLRCDHCGIRGVLVAAYGPAASAEEADVVTALLRS